MESVPGTNQPSQRAPRQEAPWWDALRSARTSRRTFLKGAGIAGAVGLAAPLLARSSARASTAIIYGANHDNFSDWVANAPSPDGKNSERRYFDAIVPYDDGVGNGSGNHSSLITDWTSMQCLTDYAIVSLRINPVYALQSPQIQIPDNGSGFTTLDGQISHLLSTMPAHAVLTNWQEAGPSNTLNFPGYVSAANTRGLHNHMQSLVNTVRANGGHADYGQIMIDDPTHSAFGSWLGSNLDTYMVDIYDFNTGTFRNSDGTLSQSKIDTRMTNYKTAFASVTSATPLIHITETNSPMDSHRKNWFLFLTEWMSANNGYRIVSHWDPTGPDSGPWPPSATVLSYVQFLQNTYGA
jgi:hypothetical protein